MKISICCGAPVYDTDEKGHGRCSDCKENTGTIEEGERYCHDCEVKMERYKDDDFIPSPTKEATAHYIFVCPVCKTEEEEWETADDFTGATEGDR